MNNFRKRGVQLVILIGVLGLMIVGIIGCSMKNESSNQLTIASADNYQEIEKPNLSMDIKSSDVIVKYSETKQATVEYNPNFHIATVRNIEGNWDIQVAASSSISENTPIVTVYLPDILYGNVNLSVDSASFNFPLKSGLVSSNSFDSNMELILQKGFSGSIKAISNGGAFDIISEDKYENCKVTLLNNAEDTGTGELEGIISIPDFFTRNGNICEYSNGSEKNIIYIELKESGAISLQ